MFSKSTFLFAFFAISRLALATPPACLLAAVNTQDDPTDMQSICGHNASDLQSFLNKNCGDNKKAALSAFSDVCQSAGITVHEATASASASDESSTATKTGSSSHHASTTAKPTTIVYTSASFNSDCSCSKTAAITSIITPSAALVTATQTGGSAASGTAAASIPTGAAATAGVGNGRLVAGFLGLAGFLAAF